ncbi:MAG: hypothetical protein SGPRY_004184, partial [Prymnesium sp.]
WDVVSERLKIIQLTEQAKTQAEEAKAKRAVVETCIEGVSGVSLTPPELSQTMGNARCADNHWLDSSSTA